MNIQALHSSSKGNLYRVDNLLLEAGVPIKEIKKSLDYRLSEIDGCLCTHCHQDHSRAARDLMKAGVDVYCLQETAEALDLSGHRLNIIEPGKQLELGKWKILPFGPLPHDAPNVGFLISNGREKLVFAVDTNYIPHRFKGLTHIMLGVSYDPEILKDNVLKGEVAPELAQRIFRNHMALPTALDFFRANDMSKVEEVYLLHLSDMNSDEKLFKREVQKVTGRPVTL